MKLEQYAFILFGHSSEECATFRHDTDRLCWDDRERETNRFLNMLDNVGAKYIRATLNTVNRLPMFGAPSQIHCLALDEANFLKLSLVYDVKDFEYVKPVTMEWISAMIRRDHGNILMIDFPTGTQNFGADYFFEMMKPLKPVVLPDPDRKPVPIQEVVDAINNRSNRAKHTIVELVGSDDLTSYQFFSVTQEKPSPPPSTGIKAFKSPPRSDVDPLEQDNWLRRILARK